MIGNNLDLNTQFEGLEKARDWGFKVPNQSKLAKNIDEVFEFIDYWDIHRHDLPYETDGVVVKVNLIQSARRIRLYCKITSLGNGL